MSWAHSTLAVLAFVLSSSAVLIVAVIAFVDYVERNR